MAETRTREPGDLWRWQAETDGSRPSAEVWPGLLGALCGAAAADAAGLWLSSGPAEGYTLAAQAPPEADLPDLLSAAQVAALGDGASAPWPQQGKVIAAPLVWRGERLGLLAVCFAEPGAASDADGWAVRVAAQQAALLLAAETRAAEALAEQVEDLSMIHRADRELSAHLDVDRVMRLTMDWALRRTGAESGLLALLSEDGQGLTPLVTLGPLDRDRLAEALPMADGILGRAALTGETQSAEGPADAPFLPEARAVLAVPLAVRGEALGVIGVASAKLRKFTLSEVVFVERLARHAAVALDNARLFRQSQQLAADMGALYAASRTITASLERDEILERLAQSMAWAVECSSAVIFEHRREMDDLRVLAVYRPGAAGQGGEALPALRASFPLADSPAFRTVIEQRHPLALRACDAVVAAADRARLAREGVCAELLVPLVVQDDLIGVAALIEGRGDRIFSPGEVYKAEALASQAAVTLRQSVLFDEVRELEKLKTEMIRMASHDLRNPLTNALGYLKLLSMSLTRGGRVEDQRNYLDMVERSLQVMRALLEDLLTLERIESEREMYWQRLAMGGLAAEAVQGQAASATQQQQTLTVRCDKSAYVQGSETQLRQALANLLGNAIKYTPAGGIIAVSCERRGRRVQVAVRDSGYGIAPERQGRLFERFYRAREPGTEHIGGTGLGLSLVKTVIERHGGEVWFESSPGAGSTFGFWLPAAEE